MKPFLATVLIIFLASPAAFAQSGYSLSTSTYVGGGGTSTEDQGRDVSIDPDGNIYVAGGTQSSNFPTLNAHDSTHNGSYDVFVRKYSPDGQTLLWSTFLGGVNYERAYALEVNATGCYVAGRAGEGFPTTSGVLQETFAGDHTPNGLYGTQDGFVAKFTLDGVLVYSTYFGCPGQGFIRDIDVDSSGNVYIGFSDSSDNNARVTDAAASFDSTFNGGTGDAVAAKINTDATAVVWAGYLGGSGNDGLSPSVRVNGSGELFFLTTGFYSSGAPSTAGAYDTTPNGQHDFLLAKIHSAGTSVLWATYYGGSDFEVNETHNLAIDSQGRPVIAATTKSTNIPTAGSPFDSTHNGNATSGAGGQGTNYDGDCVIAIFDPSQTGSAQLVAATYLGSTQGEGLEGVSADATGIYVTGSTYSDSFPTAGSPFQSSRAGAADGFVAKLSTDLSTLIYGSYIGGANIDQFRGSTVWNQRLYAVGVTESPYDIQAAHQSSFGGGAADATMSVFAMPGREFASGRSGASGRGAATGRQAASNRVSL